MKFINLVTGYSNADDLFKFYINKRSYYDEV